MRSFRWLGLGTVPASADLRRRGWQMRALAMTGPSEVGDPFGQCLLLIDAGHRTIMRWLETGAHRPRRRMAMVLGVNDPVERARLLAMGVGDVLGTQATLAEIDARATRILGLGEVLPRYRGHGPLRLDLLDRDGFVDDKPLGLHPREFALLWRLLETPGEQVDKAVLLRDVWHLKHVPETNSIAVHASRLRSKLEHAGLADIVLTGPSGGYFVAAPLAAAERGAERRSGRRSGRRAGRRLTDHLGHGATRVAQPV